MRCSGSCARTSWRRSMNVTGCGPWQRHLAGMSHRVHGSARDEPVVDRRAGLEPGVLARFRPAFRRTPALGRVQSSDRRPTGPDRPARYLAGGPDRWVVFPILFSGPVLDRTLAFRGGTALYKVYLTPPVCDVPGTDGRHPSAGAGFLQHPGNFPVSPEGRDLI